MAHEKKSELLGMNFMTARSRLDRDLLFDFVVRAGHKCHRCGEALTRDDFSVEHKTHWSSAEDPKASFFDLTNIAYSHFNCNSKFKSTAREHNYAKGCRCDECRADKRRYRGEHDPVKRRARYEKYGN